MMPRLWLYRDFRKLDWSSDVVNLVVRIGSISIPIALLLSAAFLNYKDSAEWRSFFQPGIILGCMSTIWNMGFVGIEFARDTDAIGRADTFTLLIWLFLGSILGGLLLGVALIRFVV